MAEAKIDARTVLLRNPGHADQIELVIVLHSGKSLTIRISDSTNDGLARDAIAIHFARAEMLRKMWMEPFHRPELL